MTQQYAAGFADGAQKEQTIEYLIRRFEPQIKKIAYYHVRDRYLAEDIAQETFCRAFRHLDKFRGESSYYTWLFRITVNLCRDYMASAYVRRILPVPAAENLTLQQTRTRERSEGGEVFSLVMDLPPKYRTVISLYYFEDMTTAEIAAVLKLKESTVRTRLARGRQMLRTALEEREKQP